MMSYNWDDLQSKAADWTLSEDSKLLELLQDFSHKITAGTHEITERLDQTLHEATITNVRLNNAFNDFIMLATTQFVENRVYEEDTSQASCPKDPPKEQSAAEREAELVPQIVKAVQFGLNLKEPSKIQDLQDHYLGRHFPALIGCPEFFADDLVGLGPKYARTRRGGRSTKSAEGEAGHNHPFTELNGFAGSQKIVPEAPNLDGLSKHSADKFFDESDADKSDADKSDADKSDTDKSDADKSDADKSDADKSDAGEDGSGGRDVLNGRREGMTGRSGSERSENVSGGQHFSAELAARLADAISGGVQQKVALSSAGNVDNDSDDLFVPTKLVFAPKKENIFGSSLFDDSDDEPTSSIHPGGANVFDDDDDDDDLFGSATGAYSRKNVSAGKPRAAVEDKSLAKATQAKRPLKTYATTSIFSDDEDDLFGEQKEKKEETSSSKSNKPAGAVSIFGDSNLTQALEASSARKENLEDIVDGGNIDSKTRPKAASTSKRATGTSVAAPSITKTPEDFFSDYDDDDDLFGEKKTQKISPSAAKDRLAPNGLTAPKVESSMTVKSSSEVSIGHPTGHNIFDEDDDLFGATPAPLLAKNLLKERNIGLKVAPPALPTSGLFSDDSDDDLFARLTNPPVYKGNIPEGSSNHDDALSTGKPSSPVQSDSTVMREKCQPDEMGGKERKAEESKAQKSLQVDEFFDRKSTDVETKPIASGPGDHEDLLGIARRPLQIAAQTGTIFPDDKDEKSPNDDLFAYDYLTKMEICAEKPQMRSIFGNISDDEDIFLEKSLSRKGEAQKDTKSNQNSVSEGRNKNAQFSQGANVADRKLASVASSSAKKSTMADIFDSTDDEDLFASSAKLVDDKNVPPAALVDKKSSTLKKGDAANISKELIPPQSHSPQKKPMFKPPVGGVAIFGGLDAKNILRRRKSLSDEEPKLDTKVSAFNSDTAAVGFDDPAPSATLPSLLKNRAMLPTGRRKPRLGIRSKVSDVVDNDESNAKDRAGVNSRENDFKEKEEIVKIFEERKEKVEGEKLESSLTTDSLFGEDNDTEDDDDDDCESDGDYDDDDDIFGLVAAKPPSAAKPLPNLQAKAAGVAAPAVNSKRSSVFIDDDEEELFSFLGTSSRRAAEKVLVKHFKPEDAQDLPPAGTSSKDAQNLPPAGTSSKNIQNLSPAGTSSEDAQNLPPAGTSSKDAQNLPPAGTSSKNIQNLPPAGTSSEDAQSLSPAGMSSEDESFTDPLNALG